MDPKFEKYNNSCGIKKGNEVQITVWETYGKVGSKGGALLWSNTSKEYGTMHAVIKDIYTAGRYVEINLLPLQFIEYNDFAHIKSPNLSNNETLANFIHYDGVPECIKQLQIGETY